MNRGKYILTAASVLLSCNLFLSACQKPNSSKKDAQTHQKNKKTVKKSASKDRKLVAGIDYETEDGFLLSDKSQIKSKTPEGIVVKHGKHVHFMYYSDLKGTKWEHLIPKNYTPAKKSQNNNSHGHHHHHNHDHDNYVFNPNDVVSQDANGYIVRHGDHFHYIEKSKVQNKQVAYTPKTTSTHTNKTTATKTFYQSSISKATNKINQMTDDGFIFTGQNITHKLDSGLVVKHGNHSHFIPYSDLKNTKWDYLVPQSTLKQSNVKAIETKTENKILEEPKLTDPALEQEVANWKKLLDAKYAEIFALNKGVPEQELRSKIKFDIEQNYIIYPHGNHEHIEAIDPNKPMKMKTQTHHEHHHPAPPKYDTSIEDKIVVGPIFTNTMDHRQLYRDELIKNNPNLGIKDINNYWTVSYIVRSANEKYNYGNDYGTLKLNGQSNKAITYLVRKDKAIQDVNLPIPEAVASNDFFFKNWSRDLTKEAKLKNDVEIYANFRHNRHKDGQKVFLNTFGNADINAGDYVDVYFSTFRLGKLRLDNQVAAGFKYMVRDSLTWNQALKDGMKIPQAVPANGLEFVGWDGSDYELLSKNSNKPVSTKIFMAKFGVTRPVINGYIPSDQANPLNEHDRNRPHPNDINNPYDPNKYMTIVFDAGEHAKFKVNSQTTQHLAYVVRKGTTWMNMLMASQGLPQVVNIDEGYTANRWNINMNDQIQPGIYKANVTKLETKKDSSQITKAAQVQQNNPEVKTDTKTNE